MYDARGTRAASGHKRHHSKQHQRLCCLKTLTLYSPTARLRNAPPTTLFHFAPYRHCDIRVSGTLATASPYFRFGFKYYDAREPVLSAGSVQTFGQNILFHIGKNVESPTWFGTPYRAGNRAGDNTPIPDTEGISTAPFEIRITSDETVTFHLNGKPIYEQHFPVDGLANLAIMAWGDEHHFTCAVRGLQVNIQTISTP